MLIAISEVFEIPVSTLLGETIVESKVDDLKVISEKLEIINLQLAQRNTSRRKFVYRSLILFCIVTTAIFIILLLFGSPYLSWDYSDPETAVIGTLFHGFEWLFVRLAPILLIGVISAIFTVKNKF